MGSRRFAAGIAVSVLLSASIHAESSLGASPTFPPSAVTMLADLTPGGTPPDGRAYLSALSGDGGVVAFVSKATDLVPNDTNGVADVFVHDFVDGSTTRASVASDGTEGDAESGSPDLIWDVPVAISSDGRFVAFVSSATNLVPNDTNGLIDVFVHDCTTGATTRVSVASDGTEANGPSRSVSISDDGRSIGYFSVATDLTADQTNSGVYVHDTQTGDTVLGSVASDGTPAPVEPPAVMSGDGQHVAFESIAPGIVPGDTNGGYDVFEHDLVNGQTTRVSVTSSGRQQVGNGTDEYGPQGPAISYNGRFVAFASAATNLVPNDTEGDTDVFVHDRHTGSTSHVNVSSLGIGDGDADYPVMSEDGRYVGFWSSNWTLAPCGTNSHGTGFAALYVRDLQEGTTVRVSTYADGVASSPYSGASGPSISRLDLSGDGHVASYTNDLPLEPSDTNDTYDAYIHDVVAPVGAPDASIALVPRHARGVDRCGPTPRFQVMPTTALPGETVTFTLGFKNRSDSPDALFLHGGGGAAGFSVSYFRGGRNITKSMLAGNRRTPSLLPGMSRTYTMRVHVRRGATAANSLRVVVDCSSAAQPAVKDVVAGVVTVGP